MPTISWMRPSKSMTGDENMSTPPTNASSIAFVWSRARRQSVFHDTEPPKRSTTPKIGLPHFGGKDAAWRCRGSAGALIQWLESSSHVTCAIFVSVLPFSPSKDMTFIAWRSVSRSACSSSFGPSVSAPSAGDPRRGRVNNGDWVGRVVSSPRHASVGRVRFSRAACKSASGSCDLTWGACEFARGSCELTFGPNEFARGVGN